MVCVPASSVVFLSIISILMDYELYGGFIPVILFSDVFISLILIVAVQWFCSNIGMGVAWLIAISLAVINFYALYLWRTNDPLFMKFVEEEKARVMKKNQ